MDDGLGLFVLTVIILLARGRIASLDHDYRYLYNIQIVYKKKKFWYRLFIIKKAEVNIRRMDKFFLKSHDLDEMYI